MLFLLFLINSASAYEWGDAPFCMMDAQGSRTCHYYSMPECIDGLKFKKEPGWTCIKR